MGRGAGGGQVSYLTPKCLREEGSRVWIGSRIRKIRYLPCLTWIVIYPLSVRCFGNQLSPSLHVGNASLVHQLRVVHVGYLQIQLYPI